ncbi:MAG TPA: UGSC family (seleno)protein, partial [Candidatus Deferrimicrobium sp.]|nr:UGSC family (seleno)protein [Candidatus Deferrimicrobium sp.]
MTLDNKYGVPTVALHTHVFEKVVESVNRVHGMPRAPRAFVPQPVMGKTAEQLRAYIDGKDPLSGRPVMQEVIEGLTQPIDDSGVVSEKFTHAATPRLVDADSEENLQQLFLDKNWTDKLPIVLPTEKRVAAMLAHTSHKPDEVVGHMRSTHFREYWEYTVEKVAVNAVMAGARPEYFPVILALASTGVTARGSTSSSAAAMVVVNGPIRNEIKMNSGTGAMG